MKRKFLLPLMLLCVYTCVEAQIWSGMLDPSRAINWTNAGATITNRTTICTTAQCNALTGSGVTGANITAAWSTAPANSVVLLPAGTFTISGGIADVANSNVTLRGAGPGQTILNFTSGSSAACNSNVCVVDASDWYVGSAAVMPPNGSNQTNWTGGYAQGNACLNVASTSGLSVGQQIILDQANSTSANTSGLAVCDAKQSCYQSGQTEASYNGRTINGVDHNQTQVVTVSSVNSCGGSNSIGISPGLYMNNWSLGGSLTGSQINIWWPGEIQGVGIENISLDYNGSTTALAGIELYDCYNCWVQNVSSTHANRNHVYPYQSKNVSIVNSYFFGTQNAASESYGIEDFISSDLLVQNNIFQQVAAPKIGAGCSGCVFAYNFWINDLYQPAVTWNESAFLAHDAGNEMQLLEGNQGNSVDLDDIHGIGGAPDTLFRNQLSGRGYNGVTNPGLTTNNTHAINVYYGWRGINILGNVLGYGGYFNQYEMSPAVGKVSNCNTSIYDLGWGYSVCTGDPGGGGYPQTDLMVESTMLRWGNYDTVTNAVRWCGNSSDPGWSTICNSTSEIPTTGVTYINGNPVPSATTLPASFYLSGTPSWWVFPNATASPFPAIGPDVAGGTITAGNSNLGGHAYPNPAANCYFNVMQGPSDGSGRPLSFNAGNCYANAQVPQAPTGLKGVVH
jgi:hypothetical protein